VALKCSFLFRTNLTRARVESSFKLLLTVSQSDENELRTRSLLHDKMKHRLKNKPNRKRTILLQI
jgi:hypothetical protein